VADSAPAAVAAFPAAAAAAAAAGGEGSDSAAAMHAAQHARLFSGTAPPADPSGIARTGAGAAVSDAEETERWQLACIEAHGILEVNLGKMVARGKGKRKQKYIGISRGKGYGGSGYTSTTTVSFDRHKLDLTGAGAKANVTIFRGQITSVGMIDHGQDYTHDPAVVFKDPGGGKGASALAYRKANTGWAGVTIDHGTANSGRASCLLDAIASVLAVLGVDTAVQLMWERNGQYLHSQDGSGVAFGNLVPFCQANNVGCARTYFAPKADLKEAFAKAGHFVLSLVLSEGPQFAAQVHCIGVVVHEPHSGDRFANIFDHDSGFNGVLCVCLFSHSLTVCLPHIHTLIQSSAVPDTQCMRMHVHTYVHTRLYIRILFAGGYIVKRLDSDQLSAHWTIQAGIDTFIRVESMYPLEMLELVLSI
jgi:hypothetical protein